jgi:hypothetical protein
MGQDEVQSLLFPPLLKGLVLHKALEWLANGEVDVHHRFDELYEAILTPRSDLLPHQSKRHVVWYPPYDEADFLKQLRSELVWFCKTAQPLLHGREMKAELELERDFRQWVFRGHIDLVLDGVPIDLKTGRTFGLNQFLLYSWLLHGFTDEDHPFEVWLWDGWQLTQKPYRFWMSENNPTLMKLLWSMVETVEQTRDGYRILEEGAPVWKAFLPKTRNYTCAPNRCSYFNICEYGQRKLKRTNELQEVAEDETTQMEG